MKPHQLAHRHVEQVNRLYRGSRVSPGSRVALVSHAAPPAQVVGRGAKAGARQEVRFGKGPVDFIGQLLFPPFTGFRFDLKSSQNARRATFGHSAVPHHQRAELEEAASGGGCSGLLLQHIPKSLSAPAPWYWVPTWLLEERYGAGKWGSIPWEELEGLRIPTVRACLPHYLPALLRSSSSAQVQGLAEEVEHRLAQELPAPLL